MKKTGRRDVDVRLILTDEEYKTLGLGDPEHSHSNARWISLCMDYSALGAKITGLPIDFQIQQQTDANENHKGARVCIGTIPLRFKN